MYISLKLDGKLLCEVGIYSIKHEHVVNDKCWALEVNTYINIENYSNALLKIPEMFNMAQKEFINDFKKLQFFKKDYYEQTSKDFPEPKWYNLSDKELDEDRYKIINIIRDRMTTIANKWGLTYSED